jgi:hypothetical protein
MMDFIEARGLDTIEAVMIQSATLREEKGDINEQILGEILKCLRIIMNIDVSV